jgi:hypothetical protein
MIDNAELARIWCLVVDIAIAALRELWLWCFETGAAAALALGSVSQKFSM